MVNTREVWLVSMMICLGCADNDTANNEEMSRRAYLIDIMIEVDKTGKVVISVYLLQGAIGGLFSYFGLWLLFLKKNKPEETRFLRALMPV